MISEKNILLIIPSFEKPKKKTKVESMSPCFINSARPRCFFACAPDTMGKPLQIYYQKTTNLLVDKCLIHLSIGHKSVQILIPSGRLPL